LRALEQVVQDLIEAPWAVGFAEFVAIVALASLPQKMVVLATAILR
jgi:hypothetical protein